MYIQAAKERPDDDSQGAVYTASWAVEITEGGKQMADAIARQHGFINLGKVMYS